MVPACGKKGPPLAPLRLVPAAVSDVSVRRAGSEVQLRFTLPTKNLNGAGRIDLARIEVYAITVAAGAVQPANRELLSKARVVGTMAVKPPPVEGEQPAAGTEADKRPAPGDRVAFVEELTAEKLQPQRTSSPESRAPRPESQAPSREPGTPSPEAGVPSPESRAPSPESRVAVNDKYAARIYVIRGFSDSGRPGQPSARLTVPLVVPPPPPTGVAATFTEHAIAIDWTPPVAETGGPALAFNVYRSGSEDTAVNAAPLAKPAFEQPGAESGREHCYVVRTVETFQNVAIESESSPPACVTPRDIFPPAAPKGLNFVAGAGEINLSWDANTESDLAGYLVLRAEGPDEILRPLTASPISETNYKDTSVKAGVRYVYAVVAVDRAGNASAQSTPIAEIAR